MKIFTSFLMGVLFILNIASIAQADIKFTHKQGKVLVEAQGELIILKSTDGAHQYFTLKLKDERLYILIGGHPEVLRKLAGKRIEVNGLLKAIIAFEGKSIPSIEVKSVKEIKR